MKSRWLGALLALSLALTGTVAVAQTTGEIEGTVSDQGGVPLPGVSVEIRSAALQGARTAVTSAQGRYRFPAIPPGAYSVTSTLPGFTKIERSAVRVTLGATATINMTMSVSVKQEVIVTGEAPVIDATKTSVGAVVSAESIAKLPLGRNFTSIANTVSGTGTDVSGNFTVYGATGLENAYIIDGLNTTGIKTGTQTKQMNQEFVQEVEVKTGGYEAEYGRVLGGTVNVITKSGGNEFHGDVFGYYGSPSLSADDAETDQRHPVALGQYFSPKTYDLGLDAGGYFVKDKVWFFGAYNRSSSDQEIERQLATLRDTNKTRTWTTATDKLRRDLFSGKLTFRLGESNTVAVSILGDPGTQDIQLSTNPGPDSARRAQMDVGSSDFAGKYDGVFGTQFLVQAQYGYHTDRNEQTSAFSNSVYREQSQAGFTTEALPGSGPSILFNEKYNRHNVKAAGTFFVGTHEVKLGMDSEFLRSSFTEIYGGTDRLTLRLNAAGTVVRNTQHRYFAKTSPSLEANCLGKIDPSQPFSLANCKGYAIAPTVTNDPNTDNLGFFLQDSWKLMRNLTVNAGVRYENQKLKDYTGTTLIDVKNEWSPRVGVIWDFMDNGKSKVFANFGRFYMTIPQDIQTRALGNEYTIFVRNQTSDKADPVLTESFPFPYVQGGELTQNGLKGMYQDELIAGLEYEIAPNWAVGVKGIYRALGRTVEDRCDVAINPDLAAYFPAGSIATCALFNVGEGNALGTIKDPSNKNCYPNGYPAADGSIPASSPCETTQARRYFRGLELTATHRFSNNFYLMANYLYSKLEGNYSGALSQTRETGQADPNINADFDYPGLVSNAYGLLRNDRRHQFKISGYYSLPFGLNVGVSTYLTTGRPYSIRGCSLDDISCGGGYSQEGYLVPRGSAGTLPTVAEADLHLEYGFRVGGFTITPVVDVFNLLNRQGVTSIEELYNNTGTVPANNPANQVNTASNPGCTVAIAASGYSPLCATNPNYGKAIAWQAPRSLRLGARVSF